MSIHFTYSQGFPNSPLCHIRIRCIEVPSISPPQQAMYIGQPCIQLDMHMLNINLKTSVRQGWCIENLVLMEAILEMKSCPPFNARKHNHCNAMSYRISLILIIQCLIQRFGESNIAVFKLSNFPFYLLPCALRSVPTMRGRIILCQKLVLLLT